MSDIKITDFQRILMGEVPGEFYIELVIRLVYIFLITLLAIRLMGKRMAAQLNKNELAALVSIAAAVGSAIQAPDRGLIPATIVVLVIIMISRLIAARSFKSQKFERLSQGETTELVKDSVLQLKHMESARISRERVFAQLRTQKIKNLGAVNRLYMEANGDFSLIKELHARPGLSVIPDWDKDLVKEQEYDNNIKVCAYCGHEAERGLHPPASCPNCKQSSWTSAIK